MNKAEDPLSSAPRGRKAARPAPFSVRSAERLGPDPELRIQHRGGTYRLYLTGKGHLAPSTPEPTD